MVQTISSAATAEKKASLREKIIKLKSSLDADAISAMSSNVADRLFSLPGFQRSRNVLVYFALKKEVQTQSMIKKCLALSKRVFVPIVDEANNDLLVSELKGLNIKFTREACGTWAPEEKEREIVAPDIIDLAIIPGLAFTRQGTRLGRGKGYYDKLLARLPSHALKVGVAFDFQALDFIPSSQRDMAVNMLLTEKETCDC